MMKRMFTALSLFGILVSCYPSIATAVPLGGLAVAVSPSGDTLVLAGDSRCLYVMDAVKMEVIKRVWLGVSVVGVQFNKGGSMVIAEDTDGTLHLIDAKTWTAQKQVPKTGLMSAARNVDLLAGLNPDSNGNVIRFLSMSDLSEKGKVTLPKGKKVMTFGLNADGSQLAVLCEGENDPSEPKGTAPPQGMQGLELDDFRLKNDGKTSMFMVFKVPDGTAVREHKLYYSPSSSSWKVLFHGENTLVVNYSNLNAQINPKGEVSLFNLDNSFNYGIGVSADQAILMTGGLSAGTYTTVGGLNKVTFAPDRMPTWPEYFKDFAVAADKTAYGSTSGYRVVKIRPGGAFEKSVPVF